MEDQALLFPPTAIRAVHPGLASALMNAAEALRQMGGERVRQGRRDPTCLHATLADVLEALAEGDEATARAELSVLHRVGAAL